MSRQSRSSSLNLPVPRRAVSSAAKSRWSACSIFGIQPQSNRPGAQECVAGQLSTIMTSATVTTAAGTQATAISRSKTDGDEEDVDESKYIPITAVYAYDRTGVEMRNGYRAEHYKAIAALLGNEETRFARRNFSDPKEPRVSGQATTSGISAITVCPESPWTGRRFDAIWRSLKPLSPWIVRRGPVHLEIARTTAPARITRDKFAYPGASRA